MSTRAAAFHAGLMSETHLKDAFFGEAVIRGGRAVMLVTFEAPYSPIR